MEEGYRAHLNLEELLEYYSHTSPKYTIKQICSLLNINHGIGITERKVRYLLQKRNIKRKKMTEENLLIAVENELETSRSLVGYRQMSEIICLKYEVHVSKESVRRALLHLDPEGVAGRRRRTIRRRIYETKGPCDVYHIDGNDKLKRWGICIHGGIDGFSRKILWLKAATTNNDPLVIVNYFLQCVKLTGVAPNLLRMDKGTENIYCEKLQVFFTNDDESFRYAASTRNQRIEAFWSRLKKFNLSWWISLFKKLDDNGIYKAHLESHQETFIFCFLPLIQKELNEVICIWNKRNVRQSSTAPGGKPDILFTAPETIEYERKGVLVTAEDVQIAEDTFGIVHTPNYKNEQLHELLTCYIFINGLKLPNDVEQAIDLFTTLVELLKNDGFET